MSEHAALDGGPIHDVGRKYDDLKRLSCKAVIDYDELWEKFNNLQQEHEKALLRLQEQDKDLETFQNALEPVCNEYDRLQTDYHVEKELRSHAEKYASQITKDNYKLKRQSNMLMARLNLSAVPIDISIDDGDTDDVDASLAPNINDAEAHWKTVVEDLETRVASLESQLDTAQKELQRHEAEYTSLKSLYDNEHATLQHIQNVSAIAYADFVNLQAKYEEELTLRQTAEEFARKMLRERDTMVRQSSAIITAAARDDKLLNLMNQIEELQMKLSHCQAQHASEVEILRVQLAEASNTEHILLLEEKAVSASNEISRLQASLETAHDEVTALKARIQILVAEGSSSSTSTQAPPPAPPPPPPPPPPGPPGGIVMRIFAGIVKSGKKPPAAVTSKGAAHPARTVNMDDAINEMMKRIKSGSALRPVSPASSNGRSREVSTAPSRVLLRASTADSSGLSDDSAGGKPSGTGAGFSSSGGRAVLLRSATVTGDEAAQDSSNEASCSRGDGRFVRLRSAAVKGDVSEQEIRSARTNTKSIAMEEIHNLLSRRKLQSKDNSSKALTQSSDQTESELIRAFKKRNLVSENNEDVMTAC